MLDVVLASTGWLLRAAAWLVVDGLILRVGWWIGWPVLRALTLGRWPADGFIRARDRGSPFDLPPGGRTAAVAVPLVGWLTLFAGVAGVAAWLGGAGP